MLDEVQRVPSLLSWLQGVVDEDPRPGRFILTGSHAFELMASITQSLAGRTALLNLLPLSLAELRAGGIELATDRLIFSGGYRASMPRAWTRPSRWATTSPPTSSAICAS